MADIKSLPEVVEYSFRFLRNERCWMLYEKIGNGTHSVPHKSFERPALRFHRESYFDSKAQAREFAKERAARLGYTYSEWVNPPEPTVEEARQREIRSIWGHIKLLDDSAQEHCNAGRYLEAADELMRSARWCMKWRTIDLSQTVQAAKCAAARAKAASRCLRLWSMLVKDEPPPATKMVPVAGEGKSTEPRQPHLRLVDTVPHD